MNLPPFICPVLYGLEQAYFLSAQGIKLHIKLKVLTVTRSIINDYIQDTLSGCSRLSLLHGRFLVNVQITISGRCCYTRVVYSTLCEALRRNYRNNTGQPSECVASSTLSQRHPMWLPGRQHHVRRQHKKGQFRPSAAMHVGYRPSARWRAGMASLL